MFKKFDEWIIEKGLKTSFLAGKLKITTVYLWKIRKGINNPSRPLNELIKQCTDGEIDFYKQAD